MRRLVAALLVWAVASCTPGGVTPAGGSNQNVSNVVTIDVSLSAFGAQQTPAGLALGFSPDVSSVPVGSGVRFVNVDNTVHTASMVVGTTFPQASPLGFSATSPSSVNTVSSQGWSSGSLQAGQTSQVFLVDRPGVYLYGCFYHYSGMMRGEIDAQ